MKLLPNGNLVFEKGERIPLLSMYKPVDAEALEFEPKFDEPCEVRVFKGKQCPKSERINFTWWCVLKVCNTSITDCRNCDVPKAERNIQTAESRGLGRGYHSQ